jgi:hypothetical protein
MPYGFVLNMDTVRGFSVLVCSKKQIWFLRVRVKNSYALYENLYEMYENKRYTVPRAQICMKF